MAIYKKLLAFQMQDITIKKDGKNPHFKSTYATLNQVLEKIKKPLNDMQILILQTPEKDGLRTTLMDMEDDTKVECFMPYTAETTTAQKLGSNNTYNRRYSLVTLLGLEDEDDDGHTASQKNEPTVQYAPKPTTKATVAHKKSIVEQVQDAIHKATTGEELAELSAKVNGSAKFTNEEKIDLQDSIEARASFIS